MTERGLLCTYLSFDLSLSSGSIHVDIILSPAVAKTNQLAVFLSLTWSNTLDQCVVIINDELKTFTHDRSYCRYAKQITSVSWSMQEVHLYHKKQRLSIGWGYSSRAIKQHNQNNSPGPQKPEGHVWFNRTIGITCSRPPIKNTWKGRKREYQLRIASHRSIEPTMSSTQLVRSNQK